jgi:tetratricopeptide (TPR) repeat protein
VPPDSLFPALRFSATERRTVLVGREADMAELNRAYVMARNHVQTRTVTVLGATGIGKTRLVRDFLVRARDVEGRSPRVFRGSAREGGPAYEVFARILRGRFGIVEGMDEEAAKAQVRTQLAALLDDRKVGDVAYFLGQLLELGFQDSPLVRAVVDDPLPMRSMRRAVIKNFLETDAGKGTDPLILVFDDLQWAHDDSLELLAYLVENLRGPILLVCAARPEMLTRHDGWKRYGGDRHVVCELGPLDESDAAAFVRDLLAPCGDAVEIEELADTAVTLAGGNPALLEQIVRIYHDAGVLEATDDFEDERWIIRADKLAGVQLPLTVQDAVQARIAALVRDDRQLLERAAAMGSVFWLGGLVAIHRQGESAPEVWEGGEADDVLGLRKRLAELVDRDYVLRLPDSTFGGDEEYVFKHNLEREALERLTPPAAARRYHRAIAEWLSFRGNVATSEEYLEMLARHREKAGALSLAASSYVRAGEVARSRCANAKAAELFAKGIGLLDDCDHADEDLRLRAVHHYGDVLQALGRNAAAHRAFTQVLARAWRLDLRSVGGTAHSRIGRLYRETGRMDQASRHLTAALSLFGQAQDDPGIAAALDDIGKLHWLKADYALALEYALRSLSMRRKLGDRPSAALSLNNLGFVHHEAGNFTAAVDAFDQALRIRREIGDLVGASITLSGLAAVVRDMREHKRALALFQEAYEAGKEMGDRNRIATILTHLGAMHDRAGDTSKALGFLKQAEDLTDELGDRRGLGEALHALGKAYLARRDYDEARAFLQRAVDLFTEVESPIDLGIALRTLAELSVAMRGARSRDAADLLKRSIGIFETIGNEVELARSCRACADVLRQAPEYATSPELATEAAQLAKRAEELLARTRGAMSGPAAAVA